MDSHSPRAYASSMPDITLSNDELQAAAMGCRIGAAQAEQDAERQENPRLKTSFVESAQRYLTLAAKFESTRKLTCQPPRNAS
jgi:molecular chaperone GrpE (heat shock protein)